MKKHLLCGYEVTDSVGGVVPITGELVIVSGNLGMKHNWPTSGAAFTKGKHLLSRYVIPILFIL